MEFLNIVIALAVVVLIFNFMIFIHELGHFWAARWRGLHVEKFYIWFGKPIWKKTIKGVEYGLGSIPLGGYVALPQMAPMEAIEGGDGNLRQELPPIKPLDKIIVAFAGPLFSFLLAFVAACGVWIFGKPADTLWDTHVGYVKSDSPAERAGIQVGDDIKAVDGEPVERFIGGLDGFKEKIMLSRFDTATITVERNGELLDLETNFTVEGTPWWRRRAMREVGVTYSQEMTVDSILPESPAERAGFEIGDTILSVDNKKVYSIPQLSELLKEKEGGAISLLVQRGDKEMTLVSDAVIPLDKDTKAPEPDGRVMLGIGFDSPFDMSLVRPSPTQQVQEGVLLMYATLRSILSKDSNIKIQHLNGPVGIGTAIFGFIRTDEAVRRVFWFMVIININLAIMNLLPLPVLDGGHIVLAIAEKLRGQPMKLRLLEFIQLGFVAVLFSLFIYVTSKDVTDLIPRKKDAEAPWGVNGYFWPSDSA